MGREGEVFLHPAERGVTVQTHIPDSVKTAGDIAAATLTVAVVAKWLPAVAAFLTIIWTALRIWETDTVKGIRAWVRRRVIG